MPSSMPPDYYHSLLNAEMCDCGLEHETDQYLKNYQAVYPCHNIIKHDTQAAVKALVNKPHRKRLGNIKDTEENKVAENIANIS